MNPALRRTSVRAATLVVAAAVLAACGSTVQVNSSVSGPQQGDGLTTGGGAATTDPGSLGSTSGGTTGTSGTSGSTTSGGSTGSTGGTSSTSTSGSSSSSGTSGTSGSATSGTTTGATTAPGSGAVSGRGFTKSTISIGVGTADDSNSYASSFGIKGAGYEGNPYTWMQAAADDINKHGGLAGRKIVLVKHDYNSAQLLTNTAAANQAACVTWTQDKPVAAVLLAGLLVDDTLLSCLAKAGTPLIYPGAGLDYPLHYNPSYKKFPLFFNLAQMTGDRFDAIATSRLVQRKFFAPWDTRNGMAAGPTVTTKVGLIGFDDPDGALQLASQQKQLKARGVKVGSVVQCPRSLTDKISCEQSSVLKFASNGITHVYGADSIFMKTANSQGYRPRYFVAVEPQIFAANVPASQLVGAMGESYNPFLDVAPTAYPGDPTPATTACKKLMKAAGQASADAATLNLQMSVCDEFNYLRAAVAKSGALGTSAVRAGLEALGSSQQSALTWTSFLSPTEHTSAVALRDVEFRNNNFVYTSKTNYSS